MKIGAFVQQHLPQIFRYCEAQDPTEFARLQDTSYSKATFDINLPFCQPLAEIAEADQVRYWRQEHHVQGVTVRVCSQWLNPPSSRSLALFRQYLYRTGIAVTPAALATAAKAPTPASKAKTRYRSNAIGNAQNAMVRNLLSRLGSEHFKEADWLQIIADFGRRCAYCGERRKLVMDHAVPISRKALGEHRLGNLVPACDECNSRKGDRDFREFLGNNRTRIEAIEAHMITHGYEPIGANSCVSRVIELAHEEVRKMADRYAEILEAILEVRPEDEAG